MSGVAERGRAPPGACISQDARRWLLQRREVFGSRDALDAFVLENPELVQASVCFNNAKRGERALTDERFLDVRAVAECGGARRGEKGRAGWAQQLGLQLSGGATP